MRPRSAARSRFLGLWSAGWLAVLLIAAMLRFGDPAVQWPVLVVPLLWALVALRPRRGSAPRGERRDRPARGERAPDVPADRRYEDDPYDDRYDDRYAGDEQYDDEPPALPPGTRTDTVERPALRRPHDPREDDRW